MTTSKSSCQTNDTEDNYTSSETAMKSLSVGDSSTKGVLLDPLCWAMATARGSVVSKRGEGKLEEGGTFMHKKHNTKT